MGKSVLGSKFKRKDKEYMKTSIKLDNLNTEMKVIFLKSVTKDYVECLKEVVEKDGNEKDKSDFKEFYLNFNRGEIDRSLMGVFAYFEAIFGDSVNEKIG